MSDIDSEIRGYEKQEYDDYMFNLDCAHRHAQQALNSLYRPNGPKRGFFRRWRLGRAQSILISLYTEEKRNEDRRN